MFKKFKFVLICLFILTCTLVLASCSEDDVKDIVDDIEMTDEEIVITTLNTAAITYANGDSESSVTGDITLGVKLENASCTISWSSNNEAVITNDGKVTRPDADTVVKMTLTVQYNETKLTKSFNITVKAKEEEGKEDDKPAEGETTIAAILSTSLESGATSSETYKVRGTITAISNTIYGDLIITDGTNELDIYGLYDSEGNKFGDMTDKPQVGDKILVEGYANNYQGTIELKNATLIQIISSEEEEKEDDKPAEGETTIAAILALDVADNSTTTESYKVRGTITAISNTIYGNCTISDGTNELGIYGLYDGEGNKYGDMADKPQVGDIIVVSGVVNSYQGTKELKNATLIQLIASEEGKEDAKIIDSTIAEVLKLAVESGQSTTDCYKISGTILSFTNTTYGNCYIADGESSILVYGIYDSDGKYYSELETQPKVGDKITIYGNIKNYSGTLELVNGILTNIEEGEEIDITEKTIKEILALSAGYSVKTSGTVIATHTRGFIIKDDTDYILIFMNTKTFTYVVGDVVSVEGVLVSYHNRVQFDATCTTNKTGTVEYSDPSATVLDATGLTSEIATGKMGDFIELTGKLVTSEGYYNVTLDGTDNALALTYPSSNFNLSMMLDKQVKVKGYVLDTNTDATRLNVMVTSVECLEELEEIKLPLSYNFACSSSGDTTLPSGWEWTTKNSDGCYAAKGGFYQSFRKDGQGIKSPVFKAVNGLKLSFNYYMNNKQTEGNESNIKVTAYDKDGKEITSVTSDNLNVTDDKLTGLANEKTLEITLKGEGICSIAITFVKNKGGNLAFNTVKIEEVTE